MKKSISYLLIGVLLGLGAPLGALLIHTFSSNLSLDFSSRDEWNLYSFFYTYMTLGTCSAFGLFGHLLGRKSDAIINKNIRLEKLTQTDPLTGLGNHRFLHEVFKIEFRKHLDTRQPISCLMMDLDLFKRVNDAHGHPFGDMVLKIFAQIIEDSVRQGDIATRYGGEEFLCILPNCDEANALMVAERIRKEMEKEKFRAEPHDVSVTVSVGVTTVYDPLESNYHLMIDEADKNLYAAKQRGRNQVVQTTLAPVKKPSR